MFSIGDRVIFRDEPKGSNLSMNGRIGTVDNDKENTLTGGFISVKWDDKQHDDGYGYCNPKCLVKIPVTPEELTKLEQDYDKAFDIYFNEFYKHMGKADFWKAIEVLEWIPVLISIIKEAKQ